MAKLYESPCYCTNLRRSANAVSDYYDARLRPSGLTAAQYYLLLNLSRLGSANMTRWAEHVVWSAAQWCAIFTCWSRVG